MQRQETELIKKPSFVGGGKTGGPGENRRTGGGKKAKNLYASKLGLKTKIT